MNLNKKVFKLIIIFYPILDIIYGIMSEILMINIPVNQIVRVGILVYLSLKIRSKKRIISLIMLSSILMFNEIIYKYTGYSNFNNNIQYVIKVVFFVVILYSVESMLEENKLSSEEMINYLNMSGYIIIISIILSVFGIGFKSYGNTSLRFGYKGFFVAQNAVTATLIILIPLSLYTLIKSKFKIKNMSCYILLIISAILVGTKSGIAGALVILALSILYIYSKSNLTYLKISLTCFSIIGIGLLLFMLRNVITNYLNAQIIVFNQFNGSENLYSYLVSNRNIQIQYIQNYIQNMCNYNPVFISGLGYKNANDILNSYDRSFAIIEMDFYSILYYSGVWVLMIIALMIIKRFIKGLKLCVKSKFDLKYFCLFLSIGVGTVHSIWGGHVIFEALTELYYASILAIVSIEYKTYKEINL